MGSAKRVLRAALLGGLVGLGPLAAPFACEAPADAEISEPDRQRLAGLETSRQRGLGAALLAGSPADRQALSALFAAGQAPADPLPDGDYRCRVLKLGGLLPLTVYGYFDCTVSAGAIEKLTGSQRFSGTLTPASDGGFLYAGALHYGDEAPIAYGADAERDQVGCLYRVGGDGERYRLELPSPHFESVHDIVELVPES